MQMHKMIETQNTEARRVDCWVK